MIQSNTEQISILTHPFQDHVTHMESLKFPTMPGVSPGVGLRKQGLLALQIIPCTQGSVPADGIALLGKWPGMK